MIVITEYPCNKYYITTLLCFSTLDNKMVYFASDYLLSFLSFFLLFLSFSLIRMITLKINIIIKKLKILKNNGIFVKKGLTFISSSDIINT